MFIFKIRKKLGLIFVCVCVEGGSGGWVGHTNRIKIAWALSSVYRHIWAFVCLAVNLSDCLSVAGANWSAAWQEGERERRRSREHSAGIRDVWRGAVLRKHFTQRGMKSICGNKTNSLQHLQAGRGTRLTTTCRFLQGVMLRLLCWFTVLAYEMYGIIQLRLISSPIKSLWIIYMIKN